MDKNNLINNELTKFGVNIVIIGKFSIIIIKKFNAVLYKIFKMLIMNN